MTFLIYSLDCVSTVSHSSKPVTDRSDTTQDSYATTVSIVSGDGIPLNGTVTPLSPVYLFSNVYHGSFRSFHYFSYDLI